MSTAAQRTIASLTLAAAAFGLAGCETMEAGGNMLQAAGKDLGLTNSSNSSHGGTSSVAQVEAYAPPVIQAPANARNMTAADVCTYAARGGNFAVFQATNEAFGTVGHVGCKGVLGGIDANSGRAAVTITRAFNLDSPNEAAQYNQEVTRANSQQTAANRQQGNSNGVANTLRGLSNSLGMGNSVLHQGINTGTTLRNLGR